MFVPITTHDEFESRLKDRLRRQCEVHRQELDDYRAQKAADLAALEEQVRALRIQVIDAEARAAAADLGFINPAAGVRVADVISLDVEVDQEGRLDVARIRELLRDFAAEHPYFLTQDAQNQLREGA